MLVWLHYMSPLQSTNGLDAATTERDITYAIPADDLNAFSIHGLDP